MDGLIQVEAQEKLPNLELAQHIFTLKSEASSASDKDAAKAKLMEAIKEKNMAPLYVRMCAELSMEVDTTLLSHMERDNELTLLNLASDISDAVKNLGESEVREANLLRAQFLVRIGEKEKAVTALDETYKLTMAVGQRLDIELTKIRLALFFKDFDLAAASITKASTLVEEGGDWDRRNRLKTYEGVFCLMKRDFGRASKLLLETVATFTSYELVSYHQFVRYAIIANVLTLSRVHLKAKVCDASEFLAVLHELGEVRPFMESLYNCDYKAFFVALSKVADEMKQDMFLAAHDHYYTREMRIKAYSQLLESYRSVTLASMAATFGVTEEFLDKELGAFIAAGRLNCEIDKVDGIVQTTRPDAKNAQYEALIKQGDLLLNRLQRLSRVVNL